MFGGVPSLVGAEFEEVFGKGAHSEKLHEAEFVLIPSEIVIEAALFGVGAGDNIV